MAKTHRTTPAISEVLSRAQFFGSPPIIEGEKAKDYQKLLERVFEAIAPADFIEEIWARDLADVTWSMFRLRRSLAAMLNDEVWDKVNDEASSRAEEDANKLLQGADKEALIASAQRRIDEVVRELDRHRVIRVQLNKFIVANEDIKAAAPKMITGKVIDKKVA
jgi:hypothetical protein